MGKTLSIRNSPLCRNYMIRIDESQIDRIQQLHHIIRCCCNDTNHLSPIHFDLKSGIQVLDVGSGPGTWVFDMSSDYPKSQFVGIELQPSMLPTTYPSNTRFIHNDILKGIPFPPNSFDYIHMRFMTSSFTESQYERTIGELVDVLKPNGYLELCETELFSTNMGPVSETISSGLRKLLGKKSTNPLVSDRLHEFMNQFGLQKVRKEIVMLPLSELDGKLGALYGQVTFSGVVGIKDMLAKQMKISKSEMNRLLDDYLQELKTVRMYVKYTRIYGVKS